MTLAWCWRCGRKAMFFGTVERTRYPWCAICLPLLAEDVEEVNDVAILDGMALTARVTRRPGAQP